MYQSCCYCWLSVFVSASVSAEYECRKRDKLQPTFTRDSKSKKSEIGVGFPLNHGVPCERKRILDASGTIIDPDNRRQCAYQYETVCCEGPFILPARAYDCHPCELPDPMRSIPILCHAFALPFNVSHRENIIVKPVQLSKMFLCNAPNNNFHPIHTKMLQTRGLVGVLGPITAVQHLW